MKVTVDTDNPLPDTAEPVHLEVAQDDPAPPTPSSNVIRIGTRKSKLALIQTDRVARALGLAHKGLEFDTTTVMVRGDADKVTPFLLMAEKDGRPDAAKNLWTEGMETMLCAGELDILVHSLKDMPTMLASGCSLGAILQRERPGDAVCVKPGLPYKSLSDLPDGAVVGTSSSRRRALLNLLYPHLKVHECRGNVDTRLKKLDAEHGEFSCIMLAAAGLDRMELTHRATFYLEPTEFPYAVGQGALGIEIRTGDTRIEQLLSPIEDKVTRWTCLAERAMLRELQGGCSTPVGVWTKTLDKDASQDSGNTTVQLGCRMVRPDGKMELSASSKLALGSDEDAEQLGRNVAHDLFAQGAADILSYIKQTTRTVELPVDYKVIQP